MYGVVDITIISEIFDVLRWMKCLSVAANSRSDEATNTLRREKHGNQTYKRSSSDVKSQSVMDGETVRIPNSTM